MSPPTYRTGACTRGNACSNRGCQPPRNYRRRVAATPRRGIAGAPLAAHLAAYAAVLVLLVVAGGWHSLTSSDEGAYLVQAKQLELGGWAVPYRHADADPGFAHTPFINADADGKLIQKWMYPTVAEPTPHERFKGEHDYGRYTDFTAPNPDDWTYLNDVRQEACYNEVPTKVNWHYLRFLIDTSTRTNVELQFNNDTYDLRDVPVPPYKEKYESLEGLLNFYFSVRTLSGHRNFLYLDSAVISADW